MFEDFDEEHVWSVLRNWAFTWKLHLLNHLTVNMKKVRSLNIWSVSPYEPFHVHIKTAQMFISQRKHCSVWNRLNVSEISFQYGFHRAMAWKTKCGIDKKRFMWKSIAKEELRCVQSIIYCSGWNNDSDGRPGTSCERAALNELGRKIHWAW